MYNNPQYKAFIFKHSGYGIPSSKEVVITDPNIIEIIKTPTENNINETDLPNNIIAYHGTRYKFDTFEPRYPRAASGNPKGVYFTRNLKEAIEYAQDVYGNLDEYSRVIKAKLTIDSDLDGKIVNHPYSGEEIVMFDMNKIEVLDYNILEK